MAVPGKKCVKVVSADAEDGAAARAGEQVGWQAVRWSEPTVHGSCGHAAGLGDGADTQQTFAIPNGLAVIHFVLCCLSQTHQGQIYNRTSPLL